jgi:hypothetical protein
MTAAAESVDRSMGIANWSMAIATTSHPLLYRIASLTSDGAGFKLSHNYRRLENYSVF